MILTIQILELVLISEKLGLNRVIKDLVKYCFFYEKLLKYKINLA